MLMAPLVPFMGPAEDLGSLQDRRNPVTRGDLFGRRFFSRSPIVSYVNCHFTLAESVKSATSRHHKLRDTSTILAPQTCNRVQPGHAEKQLAFPLGGRAEMARSSNCSS